MKAVQLARSVIGNWLPHGERGGTASSAGRAGQFLWSMWPFTNRRELLLGIACFATYAIAFFLVCRNVSVGGSDPSTAALSLSAVWWLTAAPAITAGWTWGMRAGFTTGIAMSPLNAILFLLAGLPGWALISAMPGVWAQAIAPLAGAVFGRLHELNCAVQAEREQGRSLQKELALTRRSLDATLQLLNDQALLSHQSLEAKSRAEAESQRSLQELNQTKVRLSRTALTDIRTDLPNRRAALEFLNQEWITANQRNRPLGCIAVTMDEIATIRAMCGLETADQVVRETAEILRDSIRETDRLFSLDGEEFLIICPNVDAGQLMECAERLRALIEVNTVVTDNASHHVTMSVGIASKNDAKVTAADALLRRAQQSLLAAQQRGANQVVWLSSARDDDRFDALAAPGEFQRRIGG